ncbi:MAG: hypothetical protein OXF79_18880 [Chloroflexi bacterium]|nr:hypothetical protein [Chloroflexota bacterium]
MPLAIYLTAISASVLPMMAVCALAAVVAAAAFDGPRRYGRRVLIGSLIGLPFGIIGHYPVRILVLLLTSTWSDPMERLLAVSIGAIVTALAAAVAGAATAKLSSVASRSVRKCAAIGGGFGMVAGIANAAVAMVVPGVGVEPTTDIIVVLALVSAAAGLSVAAQIAVDAVLAIIASRLVRSRTTSGSSATKT